MVADVDIFCSSYDRDVGFDSDATSECTEYGDDGEPGTSGEPNPSADGQLYESNDELNVDGAAD